MQSLSRRNLVASIAAVAEPDPIFAAIERWKEMDAALAAAIRAKDDEAQDGACAEVCNATMAVFKTVPTTLPGFRAKIDFALHADHVAELLVNGWEGDTVLRDFLDTLYQSARLLAA
jgi:hypothetical protein